MNRLSRTATLSVLLLAACHTARADNVGVVISAQGDVQHKDAARDKWSAAAAFQGLDDNSRVKVGGNGNAVLMLYKDGSCYKAAAGSMVNVTAATCESVAGPPLAKLKSLKLQQVKVLLASRVAGGRPAAVVLRGDPLALELTSKFNTGTLERLPRFSWAAIPGATSYKITVRNENNEAVWESRVAGTQCTYPATAPALMPGQQGMNDIGVYLRTRHEILLGLIAVAPPTVGEWRGVDILQFVRPGANQADAALNLLAVRLRMGQEALVGDMREAAGGTHVVDNAFTLVIQGNLERAQHQQIALPLVTIS